MKTRVSKCYLHQFVLKSDLNLDQIKKLEEICGAAISIFIRALHTHTESFSVMWIDQSALLGWKQHQEAEIPSGNFCGDRERNFRS